MAIELRRKSDDTIVLPGDKLKRDNGMEVEVLHVLGPSIRWGASPIMGTDKKLYLPSELGCYSTTV